MPEINGIKVTEKQHAFALEFVKNGENATDAYRQVYSTENMSDESISREAHTLKRHPKVSSIIKIFAKPTKDYKLEIRDLITKLEGICDQTKNRVAQIKAIEMLMKYHGAFEKDNNQKSGNLADMYDLDKLDNNEKSELLRLLNKAKR